MAGTKHHQAGAKRVRPLRTRLVKPRPVAETISYRWDLADDRLLWGTGAARFFGLPGMARLKTGNAFAQRLTGSPGQSRAHAVLFTNETDEGFGVPYRAVYGFARPDGSILWIEDTGRWFAGRNGRPARAEGLVRRGAEPPSLAAGQLEVDFLAMLGRDFKSLPPQAEAALFAFALPGPDPVAPEWLASLRRYARIGDRAGTVGAMLVLFARSCPASSIEGAKNRIASALSREADLPVNATALCIPRDAKHPIEALQKVERHLARPETGPDPLTRALNALNTRTLAMALQPIVAAGSRAPVFYEALARVPDGAGGEETTQDLVAALEAHGSIALLDHRMLSLAIDALETDPTLHMALNVAPRSLADPDWFRYAEVRLSRRPDLASRLLFEITEQAELSQLAYTQPQIMALHTWGGKLAIDDFGMGRTSLRHLNLLPIETVKIAGNFVQNLMRSIEDRQFVSAMIGLAQQCGMKTVAEWVEDEPTALFLEKCGVDFMQGRLFGAAEIRPVLHQAPRDAARRASAVG